MVETPRHLFPSLWHPHLQHLLPIFCTCRRFLVSSKCLSSLVFRRSYDTKKPEPGVAGSLGYCKFVCLGQKVKGVAFEVACDPPNHPSIASVCEGDHTPLLSFDNILPLLPLPHLMLDSMLCYSWGVFLGTIMDSDSLFDKRHRTIVFKDNDMRKWSTQD